MPRESGNFGGRPRSGDGYSITRHKRGGGMFNHQAEIYFNYADLDQGIEEIRKELAAQARQIKSNNKVRSSNGVLWADFDVNGAWRKNVKWRVNEIAKGTSASMKDAMLRQIGGRIETGAMKRSVYGRTERTSAYMMTSRAGWLDLFYKYFGFQEEGTKTGIRPMHSLNAALLSGSGYASRELNKMGRDFRRGLKGPIG